MKIALEVIIVIRELTPGKIPKTTISLMKLTGSSTLLMVIEYQSLKTMKHGLLQKLPAIELQTKIGDPIIIWAINGFSRLMLK